jgi:hypothetical protein
MLVVALLSRMIVNFLLRYVTPVMGTVKDIGRFMFMKVSLRNMALLRLLI